MNIKISDSWLKDYLITNATPKEITKYLSLCGPSVEKIEKIGNESVYDIEITTNRIDSASVYGIARETSVILPKFGIKARLKKLNQKEGSYKFTKQVKYLTASVNANLCQRFTAVLIRNVKIDDSPQLIRDRLELSGVRAINNVIDISNYIMIALGQPVHTFDYDKIKGAKMILRESKKGEKIETLDGKEFTLPGGDIVIEDGEGRLIDLAGIMGGNLSAVDVNTKNVLLFVQTYNPANIRKTSMSLSQRTTAATIFEKGTDSELVTPAITEGIAMFEKLTGGIAEKEILDLYPSPYKVKKIGTDIKYIERMLGASISKKEISGILNSLEFETAWSGDKLEVMVPSFRARDFEAEEDVLEEVARIYGYHNLPSKLMSGDIPNRPTNPIFEFEDNVKNYLSGWGGVEVYTLSLVPKNFVADKALRLSNPLGIDSEYLRTTLMPSLISATKNNLGSVPEFHLFEMANVYIPGGTDLPEEKQMLGGIFSGYSYREAKGIIEALLEKLHIVAEFTLTDAKGFSASKCSSVKVNGKEIGKIGVCEGTEFIYYEFGVIELMTLHPDIIPYKEISKYPSQIEDITLSFPAKTKIGEVVQLIKEEKLVENVDLNGIYKDSYTFRIEYQDPEKTLTNAEVEKIRDKILSAVKRKFGGTLKE